MSLRCLFLKHNLLLRAGIIEYTSQADVNYIYLNLKPAAHWSYRLVPVKADFHSVQNVARSIFSERFLLKCVKSTTANEICSA